MRNSKTSDVLFYSLVAVGILVTTASHLLPSGIQVGGAAPGGAAGGALTGSYPNPGVNASNVASGLLANVRGGTGADSSASSGIPSLSSGVWSFSATLPNGTRAVTQSPGTSSTTLATTSFVQAAISKPPFASLTAATGNIASTETVVTFFTYVPGLGVGTSSWAAGQMVRISAQGTCTEGVVPATSSFRVRIGPTTLTGTSMGVATPTFLTGVSGKSFDLEGYFTVRSVVSTVAIVDSGATLFTDPTLLAFGGGSFAATTGNTFDPTINNRVELTFQTGDPGDSCTFFQALLEQIQ